MIIISSDLVCQAVGDSACHCFTGMRQIINHSRLDSWSTEIFLLESKYRNTYLKVEKPNKVTLLFPTQSLTHKSGILSGIMAFYDEQNINPKDR